MARFTEYLLLLVIVGTLETTTWATDADCEFYQDIAPGTTYYIFNPEYPGLNIRERSCRWYARAPIPIQVSCQTFELPWSDNCHLDKLSISPTGNVYLLDAQHFCGTQTFTVTSTNTNINIVYTAPAGTTGGRFSCTLRDIGPPPDSGGNAWHGR